MLPPPLPPNAAVTSFIALACRSAAMMFGLLPEVEIAMATSPGRPSASIWRAKILSKPRSLPAAVSAERVGGQGERGNGGAVRFVADGQFGREMLRIAGATAIAEEHQLAAAADRCNASADQAGKSGGQRRFGAPRGVVMFGKFGFEKRCEVHGFCFQAASPRNSGTASRSTL